MPTGSSPTIRRLLVISDTIGGGLGVVARRHVEWFAARGWPTSLAAPDDGSRPGGSTRWHPLPTPGTIRDVVGIVRAARALSRIAGDEHPDVVHVHGLRSAAVATLAGIRHPYVTMHGVGPVPSDPAFHHAFRRLGLAAVPYLAIEASTAELGYGARWKLVSFASPLLGKLDVLPFPRDDGVPTFAWVGLLDQRKRPEVFVEAMAQLAKSGRTVRGLMAGTGPRLDEIAELVRATGAPIELLGEVDPIPVLARSWAVTLFSRTEAVPMSVQEAMWAGRVVVGSPLPGIRYLVGSIGRLAANADEAADALAEFCDHKAARAAGQLAAERVRELMRPDSPWSEFEASYVGR